MNGSSPAMSESSRRERPSETTRGGWRCSIGPELVEQLLRKRRGLALVAAAQDGDLAPAPGQLAREKLDHRRLARAADGQVAHADDEAAQRVDRAEPRFVPPEPEAHAQPVKAREQEQEEAEGRGAKAPAPFQDHVHGEPLHAVEEAVGRAGHGVSISHAGGADAKSSEVRLKIRRSGLPAWLPIDWPNTYEFQWRAGRSPVFHPQTWIDLLTAATDKGDMFSARTLTVILEGVEHLALARLEPNCPFALTSFSRLAFRAAASVPTTTPALLKSVGTQYLSEFRMPGIALKHLELAKQMAPSDRDIEQLEKAATAGVGAAGQPGGRALLARRGPGAQAGGRARSSSRPPRGCTGSRPACSSTPRPARWNAARRRSGRRSGWPPRPPQPVQDFSRAFEQIRTLIEQTYFSDAFAALADLVKAGAPVDEAQTCYAQLGLAAFENNRLADALAAYLKMRDMAPGIGRGLVQLRARLSQDGHVRRGARLLRGGRAARSRTTRAPGAT